MKSSPNETGAVFALNGRIVGLEMFDSPAWQTPS